MRKTSRIYLLGHGCRRRFYWVETDDSYNIYIGSSNGKLFTYGYGGVSEVDASPQRIVPAHDGRNLAPGEVGNKTSFHGSGTVNLATETDGKRDRLKIRAPRDGIYTLPLVAIIPMRPTRYPHSQKTKKPTDLCLPEYFNPKFPVGVLLYVSSGSVVEPAVISAAKKRMPFVREISCSLGEIELHALVYSDPKRLQNWPNEEVQVIAHPNAANEEPNWPLFA